MENNVHEYCMETGTPHIDLISRLGNLDDDIFKLYPYNLFIELLNIPYNEFWLTNYSISTFVKLILSLTPKEQKVLALRYKNQEALRDIGRTFNVTSERVRQMLHKAKTKLRVEMANQNNCICPSIKEWNKLVNDHRLLEYAIGEERNNRAFMIDLKMPLENMGLSVRLYNVLKRHNIDTLGAIIEFDNNQEKPDVYGYIHTWETMRNLGNKCLKELARNVYEKSGLRIKVPRTKGRYELIPIDGVDDQEQETV